MNRVRGLCEKQLEMHSYKLSYALITGILEGCFIGLETAYGIPLTEETFDEFYLVLSSKLSGSCEIEHEWTELEWKGLMKIKELVN